MPCCSIGDTVLRILRAAFVGTYGFVVVLFLACGVALVWLAGQVLWHGVMDVGTAQSARFDAILRTIGHLTIGVAAGSRTDGPGGGSAPQHARQWTDALAASSHASWSLWSSPSLWSR